MNYLEATAFRVRGSSYGKIENKSRQFPTFIFYFRLLKDIRSRGESSTNNPNNPLTYIMSQNE